MNLDPPKFKLLEPEITKEMLKDFDGERDGWVQVGEKKWFFPYKYIKHGSGYYNFECRATDTWVVSYPRSGTTWMQELVWLLANDMDFETANARYLTDRFPFLEFSMFVHDRVLDEWILRNEEDPEKQRVCRESARPGYEVLAEMQSPRFIKSHFPFGLLPNVLKSGCKVVYICRNPKDVVVSWFKLNQAFRSQGYKGDFAKFWKYFRSDLTAWSPYWEHLKEAWALREHENLLFLSYEEAKQSLPKVIAKVAGFLGKSYSPEEIGKLEDHLDIKNFRNNRMVNSEHLKECGIIREESEFVRNGLSGQWKEYFDEELEAEANEWIRINTMNTDLPYSIADAN